MKLPASVHSPGVSQDMIATLREITAFRRNEDPRQTPRGAADGATRRRGKTDTRSSR